MRHPQRLQRILGVGCRLCYFANRRPRLRSRYSEEPSGLLPIPQAGAAKQVRHRRSRRVLIFLGPLLRGFPHGMMDGMRCALWRGFICTYF